MDLRRLACLGLTACAIGATAGGSGAGGLGNIYRSDPRDTLETVTLERLLPPGTRLVSADLQVVNESGPNAWAADGDFRSLPGTPDTTHFDEVNLYWHLDHYFHVFLAELGYVGPANPVVAHLENTTGSGNTQPGLASDRAIWLMINTGTWEDPARAADVIYHEAQHVVTLGAMHPSNAESFALNEGFSDYFAAAATGDPVYGEWVYRSPGGTTRVDSPPEVFHYAHFDQVAYGGNPVRDPHANGMIWSGALWDLRGTIGAIADRIVLESLATLPSPASFSCAADAVLQADVDHHDGQHATAIRAAFAGRGIGTSLPVVTLTGPSELAPGAAGTFTARACCGLAPYRFTWWRHRQPDEESSRWERLGEGDSLVLFDTARFELRAVASDARGDSGADRRAVAVRPPRPALDAPTVAIAGPVRLAPGEAGRFSGEISGGVRPFAFRWRQYRDSPDAPMRDVGSWQNVVTSDLGSFFLEFHVSDATGRRGATAVHVIVAEGAAGAPSLACDPGVPARGRPVGLSVQVGAQGPLRLAVYDLAGRAVARLHDGPLAAGRHRFAWDGRAAQPGLYFVRLDSPLGTATRKLVLAP